MKTIKTQWNSGNFSLTHSVEADDGQVLALAEKGLLWHMQRNREHDVVLGAFEKVGDKSIRRKGFKRGLVGYSSMLAAQLTKIYGELEVAEDKLPVDTAIEEYIRDVADSKFTEETAIASRHESAGDLESWALAKCGYEGPTHGEDGEFAVELLRAIRVVKVAALAAQKAAAMNNI